MRKFLLLDFQDYKMSWTMIILTHFKSIFFLFRNTLIKILLLSLLLRNHQKIHASLIKITLMEILGYPPIRIVHHILKHP